jgi:hypothetical protein
MENLDLLIKKFQEVKEELQKREDSPLHSTVEDFMGGLKALPKGTAERGKFITAHMSHAPFISALNAHHQGKQLHSMLMNHLNSPANAGPRAIGGAKVMVKSFEDELEELEKYISPWWKFGSSKKKATPPAKVEGPAKPTGIDKIKQVSQEKIQPTSIVSDDRKRAAAIGAPSNPTSSKPAKLTGLDRIKAESQKPITATTVKKDEEGLEKGMMADIARRDGPPSPAMMSGPKVKMPTPEQHAARAAHFQAFQPKPAAPAKKLTGLDRVKAEGQKPLLRSETEDKEFKSKKFEKTVNGPSTPGRGDLPPAPNMNMAMSRDEKLTLNKGGQWNLSKEDDDKTKASEHKVDAQGRVLPKNAWLINPGDSFTPTSTVNLPHGDPNHKPEAPVRPPGFGTGTVSPALSSIPKLKPAGQSKFHVNTNAPLSERVGTPADPGQTTPGAPMMHKDEKDIENCSRCKKKPCVCIKTTGVLVDKMEKGHDEKGRCTNCGDKSCDGADCKTDHAKVAAEANNEKNKGFKNQIKVSGNGQWNLDKKAK